MSPDSEFSVAVQWVIFIVLVFFVGFSIANAVYYGRSRDNSDPNPPISKNTATTMMVINIIITILSALFAVIVMVSLIQKGRTKYSVLDEEPVAPPPEPIVRPSTTTRSITSVSYTPSTAQSQRALSSSSLLVNPGTGMTQRSVMTT